MALGNSTGLTGAPSVDNGPMARKMANLKNIMKFTADIMKFASYRM